MNGSVNFAAIKSGTNLATIICETVRLHRVNRLLVGLCPFHGERTPSLTVYPDHYHCYGCGAHGDVLDWLVHSSRMSFDAALAYIEAGGNGGVAPLSTPPPPPERTDGNAELARRIWMESAFPAGTLVEDYVHSRSLELPDEPVLRYHPQCPCGRDRTPAMVALMSDPETNEPRGVHRTFLRPDGSGKVSKMMLGPAGVIRLCDRITNGLGIAEGIETALAVAQRVGWGPVWATGSAGGIAKFPVLPQTTLNIFSDHDESGVGLKAAQHCAQRWADAARVAWEQQRHFIEAYIHLPPKGKDWDEATLGVDVP